MKALRALLIALVSAGVVLSVWGCASRASRPIVAPIDRVAILPLDVIQPESGESVVNGVDARSLPENAGAVVTAQVYGSLAERSEFRVVPDLTVAALVSSDSLSGAADSRGRAMALGKAVNADAVLFGSVTEFRERVGTALGARSPAAVAFELSLLDVRAGDVVWTGTFSKAQESLSSNLFDVWMFWRAGPRWLTAAELARLGVDSLLEDLRDALRL